MDNLLQKNWDKRVTKIARKEGPFKHTDEFVRSLNSHRQKVQ